jgi:hypothetical protein
LIYSSRTIVSGGNNDKKIVIIIGKTGKMKGIRAQQKGWRKRLQPVDCLSLVLVEVAGLTGGICNTTKKES